MGRQEVLRRLLPAFFFLLAVVAILLTGLDTSSSSYSTVLSFPFTTEVFHNIFEAGRRTGGTYFVPSTRDPPSKGQVPIMDHPEGPVYISLRPNLSTLADGWGIPTYKVRTNEKGLRETSFSQSPPPDVTRVLVIGDSFTFGVGVNRSDVWVERLEERVSEQDDRYQFINAGTPGTGMRDYYLFLKHRGLRYNPDILVVAITNGDWISREAEHRMFTRTRQRIRGRYRNMSQLNRERKILEITAEEKRSLYRQTEISDTDFSYLENISELAGAHNVTDIYYAVGRLNPRTRRYLLDWSGNEETMLFAPDEFTHAERDGRERLADGHPSEVGHSIIADRMYRYWREEYLYQQ